jgi:putative ribosome biogenesis GTPase RsgA
MARGGRTAGAREVVEGLVVAPTARHAKVEIAGVVERCLYAPALRERKTPEMRDQVVAGGHRAGVRRADRGDLLVEDVLPRSSVLARRLEGGRRRVIVANADRVLVVVSCVEPPFCPASSIACSWRRRPPP